MGNWGMAVSQKGYDPENCADRFLVFSSAFPTLKIFNVYSVSTTIPASGSGLTNKITINHNLGYFAPALVVYNGSTTIGTNKSYFMSDNGFPLNINIYTNKLEILVDEYFDQGFSNNGDTVYFTVYQFLDDFSNFTASIIGTGTSSGSSSNDWGFRISKAGYNVETCTNEQCIISSSFSTRIIHKKGVINTGNVTHSLGYPASFLGFIKLSGDSFLTYIAFIASDTNTLYPNLSTGEEFYYVIFKDKIN